MSGSGEHGKLAERLVAILGRLNDGEALSPAELAVDFGVNLRTIQRDLNRRFSFLHLEQVGGRYRLDPARLGKLGMPDLARFAALAGVRGLFPALTHEFLRELFDERVRSAYLIKGHHYEDLAGKDALFRQIESAIVECQRVEFDLGQGADAKRYLDVEPYKLLNQKGIWYLAARHAGKLKTFSVARIERLLITGQCFDADPAVAQRLAEEEGIWFTDDGQEVVLTVAAEVAPYFKRRRLIPNQHIEQEQADGSLLIRARVGHENQLLPIVRYWIPHLHIVSPREWQVEVEQSLHLYLLGQVDRVKKNQL